MILIVPGRAASQGGADAHAGVHDEGLLQFRPGPAGFGPLVRPARAEQVDALIDDRTERAGVKFRDVELIGIPLRVTVGKRGLANDAVELTDRATGQTEQVQLGQVVEQVRKAIDSAR